MRAVRREPRKGVNPMTALSQGRSVSAAYGRTLRPPRGVVSNRGKYMGTTGTDGGAFPRAFLRLLQYCVLYRRFMPETYGAGQAKQSAAGMLHLHRIKAVGCQQPTRREGIYLGQSEEQRRSCFPAVCKRR